MAIKFKGSMIDFKKYVEAMSLVFGQSAKVKDVLRKIYS